MAAGCLATATPEKVKKIADVPIITTSSIDKVAEAVLAAYNGKSFDVVSNAAKIDKAALCAIEKEKGIIARIPVSEGCIGNCTFCETKFARGPLNSFPEESILNAISQSIKGGAKEIEITSQDIGAYGIDKKTDIAELVEKAEKLEGDFKIRIGMLNPDLLPRYMDRLIEAMQSDKVYKFLHLPIQSGSNKVIRDMNRRCTAEEFISMTKELRAKIKDLAIETDIIVGYPTETERDFEDTIALLKSTRPDVTNVSKFGVRPHTKQRFAQLLGNSIINNRSIIASRVVREIQHEINSSYVGKIVKALITEKTAASANGKTDNYKQIVIKNGNDIKIGSYVNAKVYAASSNALYCTL